VRAQQAHQQGSLLTLIVGPIGIVFGDIGTSPLYMRPGALGEAEPRPEERSDMGNTERR
jgi:K+ transporter